MSQIDIAASITACKVTKGMTVTRAVKELQFLQPIFTYDLVSFFTEVLAIGNTSITIKTEVFAQRLPMSAELVKVSEAILVFVAVNKPGEKRVIEK
jgi:acyl-CoA thioesterase YciA